MRIKSDIIVILAMMFSICFVQKVLARPNAMAPAAARGGTILETREIAVKDSPNLRRVPGEKGVIGWDIYLEIGSPEVCDLDLYVYSADPKEHPFLQPVALSTSPGPLEATRVFVSEMGDIWVKIIPVGGLGRTSYRLSVDRVKGLRMAAFPVVSDDARPLNWGTSLSGNFEISRPSAVPPWIHLYTVPPDSGSSEAEITALMTAKGASTRFAILSPEGNLLQEWIVNDFSSGSLEYPPGVGLYLVVELIDKPRLPNHPGYGILLSRAGDSQPLKLDLANAPIRLAGAEDAKYDLNLPKATPAIVILDGRGCDVDVRSDRGDSLRVARETGTGRQIAYLGRPVANSAFILEGFPEERRVRISVHVREQLDKYQRSDTRWELMVRSGRPETPFAAVFDPSEASVVDLSESWSLKGSTVDGDLTDGSMDAYAIPLREGKGGLPYGSLQALEAETRNVGLNLALASPAGEVISIGESVIDWELSGAEGVVYLLVFPDPWSEKQKSGKYEVSVVPKFAEFRQMKK